MSDQPGPAEYIKDLGPGLISGASDNDPTTVASLAVIGATTVYNLSWLTILIFPMLATIQMISARVGVVTHQGLQEIVRGRSGRGWSLLLLGSVLAVNVITIGADLGAGAAALALLLPLPVRVFVVPLAVVVLAMLLWGSYQAIQRVLRYVLLVFLAYVAAVVLAKPDWGQVLHSTFLPHLSLSSNYIQGMLALLGTTLTSYAYVWQTIEESEEKREISRLGLAQADAGFGIFAAVAIFWCIVISTGATLGVHHQQVQTTQDAAQALKPVAGPLAGALFAVGLLASAALAVPVLAATSAYMLGEQFGWNNGLSRRVHTAKRFYAAVCAAVLIAVVVALSGVSPIRLLFWASIAGGLGTPISLVFLLRAASDRRVMGEHVIGRKLKAGGWLVFAIVASMSLVFLGQQVAGLL